MEDTRVQAKEQGYIETIFGRRLYLPEMHSKNVQRRQHAERTAIKAPMQGSAADIIKLAMRDVAAWMENSDYDAYLLMQVHDELACEVKAEQASEFAQAAKKVMEQAATLKISLVVEVNTGDNCEQAH